MSTYMKAGLPWLYDSDTGDIVGVKDRDGGETFFSRFIINASGNVTGLVGPNGNGVVLNGSRNAMITAVCGNSISEACKKVGAGADNSYWSFKNTIHHANTLCGSPMRFKSVTATTRGDGYGVYGYGGQTLATINGDIAAQWLAQFTTATGTPEIAIGYGLLENSISGGIAVATMQDNVDTWIRLVKARWPGVTIVIGTPHPSFSNDTAAKVLAYQQMRDYILSLDDGLSIFAFRCDAYENTSSPGTPLGTSGSPLYTDSAVHPNGRGAFLIARDLATCLKRFIQYPRQPSAGDSNNLILNGTQAATGTNTTGTGPNPCEFGSGSASAVRVMTAEQPGWLIEMTNSAGGFQDFGTHSSGWDNTSPTASQLSAFAKIEIVSGAENIGVVQVDPRFYDGTTQFYLYPIHFNTGDGYPDYQNGDVLTIVAPPEVTTHLAFTRRGNPYIRVAPHANCPAGGTYSYRVLESGVMEVS